MAKHAPSLRDSPPIINQVINLLFAGVGTLPLPLFIHQEIQHQVLHLQLRREGLVLEILLVACLRVIIWHRVAQKSHEIRGDLEAGEAEVVEQRHRLVDD